MSQNGWIGVDLDGTLAMYTTWKGAGHIGEPIPAMVQRVKDWLAAGIEVRIFTARVNQAYRYMEDDAVRHINAWCLEHIGDVLPVTAAKDFGMIELWDDRCVQVIPNTGQRADGKR